MGGIIIGIILIVIGISALTGISLFNFFIAVVLIAIGIRIIVGRSFSHSRMDWRHGWRWGGGFEGASREDEINEVAIFSSLEKSFISERFAGGKIVAVFSSAKVDFSRVKVAKGDVELYVSSVFSGVEILAPKNWVVHSSANMFFGGVDVRTVGEVEAGSEAGSVTLHLYGEAVFGGVEVRRASI